MTRTRKRHRRNRRGNRRGWLLVAALLAVIVAAWLVWRSTRVAQQKSRPPVTGAARPSGEDFSPSEREALENVLRGSGEPRVK
jgi:hypothetical protein